MPSFRHLAAPGTWLYLLSVGFVFFLTGSSSAGKTPTTLDPAGLDRIDGVVQAAIDHRDLPGAVVLMVHRGEVVFRRAYGLRARKPAELPMTPDTVFDLASLTKPVTTAASVLLLAEQGKLQLTDPVARHLPDFGVNGKDRVTIEHLLLHTGGLVADNAEADYRDGREKAWERIHRLKCLTEPGSHFLYSDVGYLVLGELVERISGQTLDVFAAEHFFTPLGMRDTAFRPDDRLRQRAAPTQERDGHWMTGEVHDPRAYLLGGVAGHAGLFSTADDLAIFVRMLLADGEWKGRRILDPKTVKQMTTPHEVMTSRGPGLRTLGWDVDTPFSANRGDRFPRGAGYGHTGFTGTSIWIDPATETAVLFLSNRVHPSGTGDVSRLRGQVASFVAAGLRLEDGTPCYPGRDRGADGVATGIDVLVREKFARLKGRGVGLVTNHTGLTRDGAATADLLSHAPAVKLVALFGPEHGIRGTVDEKVADSKDEKTGLPVYSLYGKRRKPDAETLANIDTLVYDIQDAGCRFYTYISTLAGVLEAAAEHKVKVIVLDRPNPLGGVAVEGPVLDAGRESFVAAHRLPIRHGMTVGELALLIKAERKLDCELEVVKVEGWRRGDTYDRTGLPWVNPSPNLRSLPAALLYPGVGLLETTNVSVGRGTERPFEWIGAPWIDGRRLASALTDLRLPGLRCLPVKFTPTYSTHQGKLCDGVQLLIDDWKTFRPVHTGLALAATLRRLHPDAWNSDRYDTLLGHKETWEGLRRGDGWIDLEKAWQPQLQQFIERRKPFLLYAE